MAICVEMWGACAAEMGLTPACKYCYSTVFLLWNGILVTLWFLHLYLFVLLVSRGFKMGLRLFWNPRELFKDAERRDIPQGAVAAFMYLSTGLLAWLVVGAFVLILSDTCQEKGTVFGASRPGRSSLMVN